jgi:hypothetical protein
MLVYSYLNSQFRKPPNVGTGLLSLENRVPYSRKISFKRSGLPPVAGQESCGTIDDIAIASNTYKYVIFAVQLTDVSHFNCHVARPLGCTASQEQLS